MPEDVEKIVAGLSEAQRAYLTAVAASGEPYEPRHGTTANWALRHGYTSTIVRFSDGREGPWESFDVQERTYQGSHFLGQCLTRLGAQITALLSTPNPEKSDVG